ncbi:TRAM domain-containing protein [Gordonia sp. N1V]|uniref:class I SAM-dependent RNA methyltransferase n=1 Tax=Gordonia sp. N1V TaxID=3034163 RepID=UPI0023E2CCF4|nr:TRAM domain-containing protein [Gordonia sp. N1V]MDF3281965.1 TRAM domain-containing protein [Gordonia sp. N1V]
MTGDPSDALTLRVRRPANGGSAIAHADDGRVVFVRGAIPGELVTANIVEDKSGFLVAEVAEVLEPSTHRRDSPCSAAAQGAGCCDLAHVSVEHARTLKAEILTDVLRRIGGFTDDALSALDGGPPTVAALDDAETGWRIRTRMAVDAHGRAGLHRRGEAGLVVGRPCAQTDPRLTDLTALDGRFTPYADLALVLDDDGARHLTEIAPADDTTTRARGGRRAGGGRRAAQQRRRRHERPRTTRVIEGHTAARHRVGERTWDIPVTGFWQGHRAAAGVYARTVADLVARHTDSVGTCWDLYGGAGIFAATLTDTLHAQAVHIVDSDAGALAAAEATFADDDGVEVHRGEVAATIGGLPDAGVVVLDPPRTGAGARVIGQLAAAGPDVVVHVGCDVARFARDLGFFAENGYQTREIRGFDAFPLTHHIEAIAVLVRSNSRPLPRSADRGAPPATVD